MSTSSFKGWVLAARPKTLTASLVPIVAATALTQQLGYEVKGFVSVLALLSALAIQIGTNFINDAIDFQKGADTAERVGPQRVTASGLFSPRQVLYAGFLCLLVALLWGIPLVMEGGMPIIWIGLASLFLAYSYTGGPFPLAYLGLGDLFVILFFGVVAVTGLFFIQTGKWLLQPLVLGLQIGFHAAVLIAINNLRDMHQDIKADKKTWAVRFGKKFSRIEISILCLAPYVLNFYWFQTASPWVALSFLSLPLALRLVFLVFKTEPGPVYNKYLGMGAGLHLIFGLLLSLGLVL